MHATSAAGPLTGGVGQGAPSMINPSWLHLLSEPETWIFTGVLSLSFPLLGFWLFHSLKRATAEKLKSRKLRVYMSILFSEWIFVGALVFLCHRQGLSASDLGECTGNLALSAVITTTLLALLGVMTYFNIRQLRKSTPEAIEKELGRLKRFLPDSNPELVIFLLLAFTAGICEELLYRGWLQNVIVNSTGVVWLGVVGSSIIFGFGHAYQGKMGIIYTSIIGMVLGVVFVVTKGLIAGQVVHAAIDVVSGFVALHAFSLLRSHQRQRQLETQP